MGIMASRLQWDPENSAHFGGSDEDEGMLQIAVHLTCLLSIVMETDDFRRRERGDLGG